MPNGWWYMPPEPVSADPGWDEDLTWLVHHYLHSNSVYGIFGIVLGLLAWIYLAVQITVYAAEKCGLPNPQPCA